MKDLRPLLKTLYEVLWKGRTRVGGNLWEFQPGLLHTNGARMVGKTLFNTAAVGGAGSVGYTLYDFYNAKKKAHDDVNDYYKQHSALYDRWHTAWDIGRTLDDDTTRSLSEDDLNQLDEIQQYANSVTRPDLVETRDKVLAAIERAKMYDQFNGIHTRISPILAKENLSQQDIDTLGNLVAEARNIQVSEANNTWRDHSIWRIENLYDDGRSRFDDAQHPQEEAVSEPVHQSVAPPKTQQQTPPTPQQTGSSLLHRGLNFAKAHPGGTAAAAATLGALGLGAIYYNHTRKKKKKESD